MFKIGDKFKVMNNSCSHDAKIGSIITKTGERDGMSFNYKDSWYINHCDVELIEEFKNNKIKMKEKFVLAFKSEPEKSFRKAGITNGDDFFTEDGQKVFLSWLLKKHGAEFKVEVVDELLKEEGIK